MEYDPSDPRLAVIVGGKSVGHHLQGAIASGALVLTPDRRLALPVQPSTPGRALETGTFVMHRGRMRPGEFIQDIQCKILNHLMFDLGYGQRAVPWTCRTCYKVKIVPTTLRQLMAVKKIAESMGYPSKSGNELFVAKTAGIYATYVYLKCLDEARKAFWEYREKIDEDPNLGPAIRIFIKRGCSCFERMLGPSDRYTFDPALAETEAYLNSVFTGPAEDHEISGPVTEGLRLLRWIQLAYQIGDETYKDFTGGQPLYPPSATYPPSP